MHPFQLPSVAPPPASSPPAKRARREHEGSRGKHPGLELHEVRLGEFARPPRPLSLREEGEMEARFPAGATLGLQPLRAALVLQPRVSQLAVSAPASYPVHTLTTEDSDGTLVLRMPRFFGAALFPPAAYAEAYAAGAALAADRGASSSPVAAPALAFGGALRSMQQQAVDAALAAYPGGAMLELPCGFGKTVIALAIAAARRERTLVLVHKEFLVDQWIERIEQFLPGARIGRLQQDVVQVGALDLATSTALEFRAVPGVGQTLAERLARERPAASREALRAVPGVSDKVCTALLAALEAPGADVVIGMIHSLAGARAYPGLDTFGLVIVDEAHHICASMFSRALRRVPAPCVLGLSATPKRPDGLGHALPWFLGPVRFRAEKTYDQAEVFCVKHLPPEDKRGDILFRGDRILLPAMVTRLLKEGKRMRLLLQWCEASYREGRYLMVISERLALLRELQAALKKRGIADVGLYIGGMKAEERDVSATKRIVLATYSMCAEGLDIPRLDTLLLASPRSNVEQSLGRILRAHPDKARPRIIDIVDDFSVFQGMAAQRRRLYRKHDFEVSTL